jgi:GTP-binding protein
MLLFVIPADADIRKEYEVLLNELTQYNPELLDKKHVLAISKSDMLDEELMHEIALDLPDLPYIFISSMTGFGIPALKDVLWRELNAEDYIPSAATSESMIHRKLDVASLEFDPEDEIDMEDLDDMEEEAYEDDYSEEEI